MKRNTLNLLIDLVSAIVMFGMIATGLIIRFALPPGSGRSRLLWTWGRHDWGDVHFWLAAAAGVLLLVHVALHWQWICNMTLRFFRRGASERIYPGALGRNTAGAVLVLVLIGLFAGFNWIARISVRTASGGTELQAGGGAEPGQDRGGRGGDNSSIRGSMTLAEVAVAGGIPVDKLRTALGVAASVSPDERLGRLRQQYGFTMEQVRQAVEGLQK